MCFECICSSAPNEKDPRIALNARQWQTSMMDALCNNPSGCCIGCFCSLCFAWHLRRKALQFDMSRYRCCQDFICKGCKDCCLCGMDASMPDVCLCCEVCCCPNLAISATRIYVQVERQIQTDPCDNRLIAFNNCMQLLSCICHCLAIFYPDLRALANLIDLIADIVYCSIQACMQAQVDLELARFPTPDAYVNSQPKY